MGRPVQYFRQIVSRFGGSSSRDHFDEAEFNDYFYNDHRGSIVRIGSTRYFLKSCRNTNAAQQQAFLSRVASRIMNVPETHIPNVVLDKFIRRFTAAGRRKSGGDSLLMVRLCQDYSAGMLRIPDLTEAIAAEIAFSTWINRRDAHNSNRVFMHGIPMFFDFDAALPPNEAPAEFFRGGPDSGYVANWRLWELADGQQILTTRIRDMERNRALTLHPVRNIASFWRHVGAYSDAIRALTPEYIEGEASEFFDRPECRRTAVDYLLQEQSQLTDKLSRIRQIMSSPFSVPVAF